MALSVEVKGLEPSASTLRTVSGRPSGPELLWNLQATTPTGVHRRAPKGAVGQQLSPVESRNRSQF